MNCRVYDEHYWQISIAEKRKDSPVCFIMFFFFHRLNKTIVNINRNSQQSPVFHILDLWHQFETLFLFFWYDMIKSFVQCVSFLDVCIEGAVWMWRELLMGHYHIACLLSKQRQIPATSNLTHKHSTCTCICYFHTHKAWWHALAEQDRFHCLHKGITSKV